MISEPKIAQINLMFQYMRFGTGSFREKFSIKVVIADKLTCFQIPCIAVWDGDVYSTYAS